MTIGGLIFIVLGILNFMNRDLVWKLYSLEPAWRRRNPERTPEWDIRTRNQGFALIIVGIIFLILSVLLVPA